MLVELRCPVCRGEVDDAAVVADKVYCAFCHSLLRVTGGTLALTSKFGLDIPDLTQRRVAADLAELRDYETLCRGKLEDCREKREWSLERYAEFHKMLPQPPELLQLEDVLGSWKFFGISLLCAPVGLIASFIVAFILGLIFAFTDWAFKCPFSSDRALNSFLTYFVLGCGILPILIGVFNLLRVMIANGSKPAENARRQEEYEKATAKALRTAKPLHEKEYYRLTEDFRKLEGTIEAIRDQAESVRKLGALRRN